MSRIYNCTGHLLQIPHVVRAEGIFLTDDAGKRYMDLESGVWCTSLGHNHPRITDVIKKQTASIMHAGFCYSNPILEESARAVLSITDFWDGQCVFLCSGSEAIELARQISRHLTGKQTSMTLHDSYLGSYSCVTDRTRDWHLFNWEDCRTCPEKDNCNAGCEKFARIPDDISAFIFEPGSASGFVRFPPKTLIRNIAAVVRKNGGKIIANEVTTGIGRTGKWFGYNHYPVEPDLVAMGKGIGNGYPVSVTAIHPSTAEQLEKTTFKYMQSHQNDPMGAAIVQAVIQTIIDEDLIASAEKKGRRFLKELESLVDGVRILAVRGKGLMFGMDLCDETTGDRIYRELIGKGYILCNRKGLFRIDPPLSITEEEFSRFIEDFRHILE